MKYTGLATNSSKQKINNTTRQQSKIYKKDMGRHSEKKNIEPRSKQITAKISVGDPDLDPEGQK
jgi:hypothetical protein